MLNKVKEMQGVSFQIVACSSRGGWKAPRVSTRKHSWRVAVALPGSVTNLSILPGMGKMSLTAGSPEWCTRGKQALPQYTTLKRVV